jgi:hypothetical protein
MQSSSYNVHKDEQTNMMEIISAFVHGLNIPYWLRNEKPHFCKVSEV